MKFNNKGAGLMTLIYYATLPAIRRVTPEDQASFHRMTWDPFELIELKQMNREDLLGLMVFCDIRLFNEMPVIACEDDELRMAYLAWRSILSRECRTLIAGRAGRVSKLFQNVTEGLKWWMGEIT
jgi:hypothetical protein